MILNDLSGSEISNDTERRAASLRQLSFYMLSYCISAAYAVIRCRLGFVQVHCKWHYLTDRIRVPIRLP